MEEKRLTLQLFAPGMTHQHRVGLAGLYMTLQALDRNGETIENLSWDLEPTAVHLQWEGIPKEPFDALFKKAFGIDDQGLVNFYAHQGTFNTPNKAHIHNAFVSTYLQQNQHKKTGTEKTISYETDTSPIFFKYKPLKKFQHQLIGAKWFNSDGNFIDNCETKRWLFFGGAERHPGWSNKTTLNEPPKRALCLLFAPIATLYYKLRHYTIDGKYDSKRQYAIVLPFLRNLSAYSRQFTNHLGAPIINLTATGLGDAGLHALMELNADDSIDALSVSGCFVVTLGAEGKQTVRTSVDTIENIDYSNLELFEKILNILPGKKQNIKKKDGEQETLFFPSLSRGLFAENIARKQEWFLGFSNLMYSQKLAKTISFEKGGLATMKENAQWTVEADKQFVEALHIAIQTRYAVLARQHRSKGERIPFDREFERMRVGLMRAKNQQTLRSELADMFARGGLNKVLQKDWQGILPVFDSPDWQRTRDLALFALASYMGKGADQIDPENELSDNE